MPSLEPFPEDPLQGNEVFTPNRPRFRTVPLLLIREGEPVLVRGQSNDLPVPWEQVLQASRKPTWDTYGRFPGHPDGTVLGVLANELGGLEIIADGQDVVTDHRYVHHIQLPEVLHGATSAEFYNNVRAFHDLIERAAAAGWEFDGLAECELTLTLPSYRG